MAALASDVVIATPAPDSTARRAALSLAGMKVSGMIPFAEPLPMAAIRLVFAAALSMAPAPAQAQAAIKLEGTCEKLVIAGQDLSASCKGTLGNLVSRNRTSFDFAAGDGQTLSFSGNGAQQERTEETDPLQPINLVIPGRSGQAGVSQTPTLAIGACRFTTPEPGKTGILCEATTRDGKTYAGSFVAPSAPAPGAPKP